MKSMSEIVTIDGIQYKTCSMCGEVKPLSEFSKKTDSPDGYQYHCRKCNREYQKDLYQRKLEKTVAEVGIKAAEAFIEPEIIPMAEEPVKEPKRAYARSYFSLEIPRPKLPEELSEKSLGKCTPRELVQVLRAWGFDVHLECRRVIRMSEI